MKLFVCWGTFHTSKGHPCGEAHQALIDAGHQPRVVRAGGCFRTDPLFPRRREVKRLTGNYKVPTLVLRDDSVIDGTANIVEWAKANQPFAADRP
jgi:glutathione S-transferase-like protein